MIFVVGGRLVWSVVLSACGFGGVVGFWSCVVRFGGMDCYCLSFETRLI